ncbi:GSCFA domain-containing protein [Aquimarina sp. 2201CG5-10]|uniref:GSCFA domain-containing protein n=1 Tax=Aquimarina callyspongiae TaxID=3098150 RepID=UPI002AB3E700|nr:GSCFA domain-containing protein [Aquimarina sp. 2201CG5-10]MDY8134598.1 GSCFA domain-containing protein [Aquimarina sp. 2201CG5-10]
MNLQTKIPLQSQEPKINYDSEVLLLGSCFAEHIGGKFDYYKFKNLTNPFGILFHPKAIETFLWMTTQREKYTDTDLFYHNEQWHCFDAHSRMSNPDQFKLCQNLNRALEFTFNKIQSATHVCITLGTAWVYRLKALDMVVANCHKIPQKEFEKELLSVDEVVQCLHNSVGLIKSLNPSVKVIFTVSPVRHIKDGFVENNRSKSHLLAAVHQTIETMRNTVYFPSYEIMMDELREYRFYNTDMIHPNGIAIEYIWERFSAIWIAEEAKKTMMRVEEIQRGLRHRPFNPNSKQHLTFLQNLEEKKHRLQSMYSFIQF